jgi:hypothetical protein
MANQFNYSNGNRTFGNFSSLKNASDYIENISSKRQTTNRNDCITFKNISNQGQFLKLKNVKISRKNKFFSFNKANLNMNLVNRLNLNNVCVIKSNSGSCPTDISLNNVPYLTYIIDPSGNLFGDSVCGLNNYTNYLECTESNVY